MSLPTPQQATGADDDSFDISTLDATFVPATRKKRTTVTKAMVASVIAQLTRHHPPTLKQIAESVGLSVSTVKKLVASIRRGVFDHNGVVDWFPRKKGRRPKVNAQTATRVQNLLTGDPTMTLRKASGVLARDNVALGKSSVWRIARAEGLSVQMITLKASVVNLPEMFDERFAYAAIVNTMPDAELWFMDESGFNLHVSPLRCWSRVGRTPVQTVPRNREGTCRF